MLWGRGIDIETNKSTKGAEKGFQHTIHARGTLSRTKLGRPLIRALEMGHKGQARPGCGSPRCLIYRPAYKPLGDSVPEDAALTCAGDELAIVGALLDCDLISGYEGSG
jgi:hypothetical protein